MTSLRRAVAGACVFWSSIAIAASAQLHAQAPRPVSATLVTLAGDRMHLGRGTPTLVAVFATWCRSCREEIATFNTLQRELGPRGVRVVGLSADEIGDARVQRWLTTFGAAYPVARDTSRTLLRALGVVGVPEAFLVDGRGVVRWSRRGPLHNGLASLRAAAGALQAEQPPRAGR